MNYASVVRVLSLMMLMLAASSAPAIVTALMLRESAQVFALTTMALGIGVLASSVLFLTPKPAHKARPSDGLAVVILWWFLSPVAAFLPFLIGVENDSVLAAMHEAAACLTTTGQSVIAVQGDDWPASLIVWRGCLHALGACASLVTAATVLAALNLGGPGIHRTILFTLPESSFFDAVPKVVRAVLIFMLVSMTLVSLALMLTGLEAPDAISYSLSAWTTGMVNPHAVSEPVFGAARSIIISLGLISGALGLALALPLRDRKFRSALTDPETVTFGGLVLLFAALAVWAGLGGGHALGWSISAMSTSGLPLGGIGTDDIVPLPLYVLPALIGGSALSAAGGVKVARLIVLSRRAVQEFRQLGYRRSVLGFEFRERELDERSVIGVWVYLIAYILAVFFIMALFSGTGQTIEASIRLAIGCLTNSGGLVAGHTSGMTDTASLLAIFSMVLGRLEVLALIPALSISFWRG